jgi:hypothetical protein
MPISKEVTCANISSSRHNPLRLICIGGYGWKYKENLAIAFLKYRIYDFYITDVDRKIKLILKTYNGREFLTTDGGDLSSYIARLHQCES